MKILSPFELFDRVWEKLTTSQDERDANSFLDSYQYTSGQLLWSTSAPRTLTDMQECIDELEADAAEIGEEAFSAGMHKAIEDFARMAGVKIEARQPADFSGDQV